MKSLGNRTSTEQLIAAINENRIAIKPCHESNMVTIHYKADNGAIQWHKFSFEILRVILSEDHWRLIFGMLKDETNNKLIP